MACHCREDASTVQLLAGLFDPSDGRNRVVSMCHRVLLPVFLLLRDLLTTAKTIIHCIFRKKISDFGETSLQVAEFCWESFFWPHRPSTVSRNLRRWRARPNAGQKDISPWNCTVASAPASTGAHLISSAKGCRDPVALAPGSISPAPRCSAAKGDTLPSSSVCRS